MNEHRSCWKCCNQRIYSVMDLAGVGSMFSEIVLYTSTWGMAKTSISVQRFASVLKMLKTRRQNGSSYDRATQTTDLHKKTLPKIKTSENLILRSRMLPTQMKLQRTLPWCARLTREFSKKPLPWSRQLTNQREIIKKKVSETTGFASYWIRHQFWRPTSNPFSVGLSSRPELLTWWFGKYVEDFHLEMPASRSSCSACQRNGRLSFTDRIAKTCKHSWLCCYMASGSKFQTFRLW